MAEGDTGGWIKLITPPGKDRILGATVVAPHAGELVGEFVLAMTHGLGLKRLMSTIHIYPTRSEAAKLESKLDDSWIAIQRLFPAAACCAHTPPPSAPDPDSGKSGSEPRAPY